MPSFVEMLEKLDLPKVQPPAIPASVGVVLDRLGLTMTLTSPSAPEQYSILKDGLPSGYIRVRWGGMSVAYPDAGDECLYEGAVDGFGGLTDHERDSQLLLALGLIAARMLKA
jgi:hypothetical protein